MRRRSVYLLGVGLALAGCKQKKRIFVPERPSAADTKLATAGLTPVKKRDAQFYRGVSLGLFADASESEHRAKIYGKLLDEIAAVGASDVQLIVRWSQSDQTSTRISPADDVSTDDAELIRVIRMAHDKKLRIFLMPILHLRKRAQGIWRGTIQPSDWNAWWGSYEAFIIHYAKLAQAHGVELFAVGSELTSTEAQEQRWRDLIAQVRKRYQGRITYSANWDHFEPVRIWDAVDVAGITAYQPLAFTPQPSARELREGWRSFRTRVLRWSAEKKLDYVFTEVGYPSNPNAARRPWDHRERGTPELDLQMECYRALYETWQADERLAGVFIWNWFGRGGKEDRGYTPRGKPAGEVLRFWYAGSAAAQ